MKANIFMRTEQLMWENYSDLYLTTLSIESPLSHISEISLFERLIIKRMIHMDQINWRSNNTITRACLAVVKVMLKAAHHFKLIKM